MENECKDLTSYYHCALRGNIIVVIRGGDISAIIIVGECVEITIGVCVVGGVVLVS